MSQRDQSTAEAWRTRQTPLPPLPATGLPPKGDPRRPVLLAVRSMRVLCVLLFIAAAVMAWRTFGGNTRHITPGTLFLNVGVYAIPGIAYLVCIFGLLERRLWTVVMALVLAGLHLLGTCVLLGALVLSAYRGLSPITEPAVLVPLIVAGAWIIAVGQLVWHLTLSVKGIRYDMAGHDDAGAAGFDVTPPPTDGP